jgi:3-dehydroquinate synthase class II
MLAAADAAQAGLQTVLMAPTEILARQHFETIAAPLAAVGIRTILLTGRDKGIPRADKLAALSLGEAAVAVGTHAVFQDDVAYKALALGASGVCIGRPLMTAIRQDPEHGVRDYLKSAHAELRKAMAFTGCATLADMDPTVIHRL